VKARSPAAWAALIAVENTALEVAQVYAKHLTIRDSLLLAELKKPFLKNTRTHLGQIKTRKVILWHWTSIRT